MSATACGSPAAAPPHRVGLTVDQIVTHAAEYDGSRVTVSGALVDVWTPQVFTIGDASVDIGSKLLIISRTPVRGMGAGRPDLSLPGARLQVTGVVRLDDIAAIERDAGFSLSLAVKQLWRPHLPAVVADEVFISQ